MSQANRRSAANAIKHGYAAIYCVRKADEPQLQAIRQTLYDTYKPSGHRETDLVNRLSVATLKRHRMEEEMQVRRERETRNAPLHHTRQCEADLRKLLAMLRRTPVNASDLLYGTFFGARHVHHLWSTMLEHLAEGATYKAGLKLVTELIRLSGSHTDIEAISDSGRQILVCHLNLSGHTDSEIRDYLYRGMPKSKFLPVYYNQLISLYTEEASQMTNAHEILFEMAQSCVDSWSQRVEELAPIHEQDLQDFITTEAGRGLGDPQLIKQFQLHERYYARTQNDIRRMEAELFRRQMRREIAPDSVSSGEVFSTFFGDHEARDTDGTFIKINPGTTPDDPASEPTMEPAPITEKAAIIELPADTAVTDQPEPAAPVAKTPRITCNVTDDSGLRHLRKRYRLERPRANELMAMIRSGQDPFMNFYDTAMVYVAMPIDTDAFADFSGTDRQKFNTMISDAICEIMTEVQNKFELYMAKEDKGYEELYLLAQVGLLSVDEYNAEVAKLDRLTM